MAARLADMERSDPDLAALVVEVIDAACAMHAATAAHDAAREALEAATKEDAAAKRRLSNLIRQRMEAEAVQVAEIEIPPE